MLGSIFTPFIVLIQLLGVILIKLYGFVPLTIFLGYLIWQNRRRIEWLSQTDTILLSIEVPKDNEKKELSAEQMFASLHGILRPKSELMREGSLQEHISLEIVARANQIRFYIWTPRHLKDFVESQVYAQYPTVHIKEDVDDYSRTEVGDRVIYGTELSFTKPDVLPIKTFASFEVDPMAGITAVLAKLSEPGEEAWIEVLARPLEDSWQKKGHDYIASVKKGGNDLPFAYRLIDGFLQLPLYVLTHFAGAFVAPPAKPDDKKGKDEKKPEMSTGQQAIVKAVEEKTNKLGYETKVRIAYLGPDEALAKSRMQAIVGGFKQFNTVNLNGFATTHYYNSSDFLRDFQARLFIGGGLIMNIEELASLYHLPHKSVETPNMVWTSAKTSEPPSNLPTEALAVITGDETSLFGLTNFRGNSLKFGIKRRDRGRHLYIVGQTGAGKSFLLQLLTLSDIYHNQGFAIIDPHGDYATDMMKYIPEHRLNDVVYFNPADAAHPMAFNPMEVVDENLRNHIASELIGVLKRMFDSWGPRLEHILRMTLLALLEVPDTTMLDITRMLNEKDFRKSVVAQITDPVIKSFWTTEFASWNEKFASEATAPVLNKVGAFTANPLVRNIVGQTKSAFNIRKIMDEGKILIVNLSRGQVGEDNSAILGALMVTKIQLAAMSRADVDLADRRPFYLYVDEFQNFATDSFAVILSEARKYGLNLTVANQYVAQMPETVRDAIFGNVGTMISFRVGPGDSTVLGKYFEPAFEPTDMTRLHNQNIFVSMIVDGEKTEPFSATTLRMPETAEDHSQRIIEHSRALYASHRDDVQDSIRSRTQGATRPQESAPSANTPGSQPSAHTTNEQKPNSFLGQLKNPELPKPSYNNAPDRQREGDRRDNRGQNRNNQPRRDNRDRRPDDRRDRQPAMSGQGSQHTNDHR